MHYKEEIADIIDDGADYIETNGWFRGDLYQKGTGLEHPPACMMGGLVAAVNNLKLPMGEIIKEFRRALRTELDHREISYYNDNVAKDAQEVLDLMRLASKRLRAEVR